MIRRLALLCLLSLAGPAPAAEPKATFKVIVNPENPATELDRKFVADLFLKKATRWPDSTLARPIDLPGDAPARQRFSEEVIGRSVAAVRSYWQQLIYSGRGVPPPEVGSDEAVVKYVLKHPGAVGYVSVAADAGGAKVVTVK